MGAHRFECLRSVEVKNKFTREEQNSDSRAEDARCIRTLTFILSLTGRGEKGEETSRDSNTNE